MHRPCHYISENWLAVILVSLPAKICVWSEIFFLLASQQGSLPQFHGWEWATQNCWVKDKGLLIAATVQYIAHINSSSHDTCIFALGSSVQVSTGLGEESQVSHAHSGRGMTGYRLWDAESFMVNKALYSRGRHHQTVF